MLRVSEAGNNLNVQQSPLISVVYGILWVEEGLGISMIKRHSMKTTTQEQVRAGTFRFLPTVKF